MTRPTSTTKRIPGKKVAASLLGLIGLVVASALTLFFLNREPKGPILAMRAAPGGRVVVLRRGFEARETVHVVLYDASGRHVWSEALLGVQRGGVPLVVGDRVVVPATDPRRRPATHLFDLDDGRFVSRAEPPPESVPSTSSARYAADGARVYELYPGDPGAIAAYELESGRLVGRTEAPSGAEALAIEGSVLWITGARRAALEAATLELVEPSPMPAREPRAIELALHEGCLSWPTPSGDESIEASALGTGRPKLIVGEGASILRIADGTRAVVLAAVDGEGQLRVARVRSPDSLAPVGPEHVGGGAVFLRTRRAILALGVPSLEPLREVDDDFEVSTETRASTGCAPATER